MTTPVSSELKLPAQIAHEDAALTEQINDITEAASMGSMLVSLLISILMYSSLNLIFSMVGSLQFILYLSMLNTNFPGNANKVFETLLTIMCFDIIPDFVMTPWYTLASEHTSKEDISDYFNQRFGQLGYATSNWVVNMGSSILFLGIMLGQALVLPVFTRTRLLSCRRA